MRDKPDIDIDASGEVSIVARFATIEEALEACPGLAEDIESAADRWRDGADPDQEWEFRQALGATLERIGNA